MDLQVRPLIAYLKKEYKGVINDKNLSADMKIGYLTAVAYLDNEAPFVDLPRGDLSHAILEGLTTPDKVPCLGRDCPNTTVNVEEGLCLHCKREGRVPYTIRLVGS